MVAIAILARPYQGGAIAAGFFTVIVGLVLRFPTLLQDGSRAADNSGNVSTMRVAVLLIVSVFGLLTIKTGWNVPRLEDLKPDSTWIGVLGVAFGGKVFQSFAESQGPKQ